MTGIVLAGGGSSRFGTDKLAVVYRGKPLVHHAVKRLARVCDEVIVVVAASSNASVVPDGVRIVRDRLEDAGPLEGLLAGLEAAGSRFAIVAGGDMPELRTAVLRELVRRLSDGEADAVAIHDGERVRPLPAAVRVERARAVGREVFEAGRRSLAAFLDAMGVAALEADAWTTLDPDRRTLFDVDDPGDLPPP